MAKNKSSELKIALLSDFTIKGLAEEIGKLCEGAGIKPKIYEGGYNQIIQEFADKKSGLGRFKPDLTFLIAGDKFLLGGDADFFREKNGCKSRLDGKIKQFSETINLFLKNIPGILIVSNLKQNAYSPLGINEDKIEFSLKDRADYFNGKIKSEFLKNNRVRIYDLNGFFLRFGENNIVNEKLRYLGDIRISPEYLSHLAEDLMGYIKPAASKNRKCIVLDLDNTLWGGIVGEDGFDNIKLDDKPPGNLYAEFQKHLLALHKRGIILAVNSRNNPEDAMKVIKEHPHMALREENFASLKINWNNKADNLIQIAKEINIGLDSMIFLDDDPANRELVKKTLPEVLTVDLPADPSLYVRTLKQLSGLDALQLTEEDFKRGAMYRQERRRNELKSSVKNLADFIKSLDLEITIAKADSFSIPRISQLTLKTNQFNLTTRRYAEEKIKKMSNDPDYGIFSVSVRDKFGDNGLTGAIMLKKEKKKLAIDNFLLSCRVIGKDIEKAMLHFIKEFAEKNNFSEIIGEYVPTKKNSACAGLYAKNGFKSAGKNLFRLKDFNKIKKIDYISINGKIA